jgi:uncharacterized protein
MKAIAEKTRAQASNDETILSVAAQELRRQIHEWEASFTNHELREAYICRIAQQIAETFQPARIVLFGSHAYGQATLESDVDLLVVMADEREPLPRPYQIRRRLNLYAPVDLHVRTVADVERRLQEGDMFIREILERGKTLYETQHA